MTDSTNGEDNSHHVVKSEVAESIVAAPAATDSSSVIADTNSTGNHEGCGLGHGHDHSHGHIGTSPSPADRDVSPKKELQFDRERVDTVAMIGGSATRKYLNKHVTKHLLDGMKLIAREKPQDPLRVLGEYLIKANENDKSST